MKSPVKNEVVVLPGRSEQQHAWAQPPQCISPTLPISETFRSRQGEGLLTGTDSFFIRTSGCNLRCWFCDTPYASWHPESQPRSIDQLLRQALGSGADHVVLTGGEPLIARRITALIHSLRQAGLHVTVETAGTVPCDAAIDLLSLSPKLTGSAPDADRHPTWHARHHAQRLPIDTMRGLIDAATDHQVKFVVDQPAEIDEIDEVVTRLGVAAETVWMMPQGVTTEQLRRAQAWLLPMCDSRHYRYCDRMQIHWYGNRRGT